MRDEEWAAGVDAIILTGVKGHAAHRALDLWWTRYALELGDDDPITVATRKWMAHIEGDHTDGRPYPLGARRWWQFWKPRIARPQAATDDEGWGEWVCP